MAILQLTAIYRFNVILIKVSRLLFRKLEQIILKFGKGHERPQIARVIIEKIKTKYLSLTSD